MTNFLSAEVLTLSTPLSDWGRHLRYVQQRSGVQRVKVPHHSVLFFFFSYYVKHEILC